MPPLALVLLAMAADPGVPGPTLAAGDELVYAGDRADVSTKLGAEARRRFAVELRVLCLEARTGSADVAVLMLTRPLEDPHIRDASQAVGGATPASNGPPRARLVLLRVDAKGHARGLKPAARTPLRLAADTPTEDAADLLAQPFAPLPAAVAPAGGTWKVGDASWSAGGTAALHGAQVIELTGVEASADWANPTAASRGWRRTDRNWVSAADGLARVLDRTTEVRDGVPVAERSHVRLVIAPPAAHRGETFRGLRREVEFAYSFAADADDALAAGASLRKRETLLAAVARYKRDHPPTAYREAIEAVVRRCEAAGR